jgi:hypothetical protein
MLAAVCAMVVLGSTSSLPLFVPRRPRQDWLLATKAEASRLYRTEHPQELVLSNGLIARRFRIAPNAATVGLVNLINGEEMIRAVKPEARLTLQRGATPPETVDIGGLAGQPNLAYLTPEWLDQMTARPDAFRLVEWKQGPVEPRLAWKPKRRTPNSQWPPKGVALHFTYRSDAWPGLTVGVHYELYDGIPLFSKWVTLENAGEPVQVKSFTSEVLGLVEAESTVDRNPNWRLPNVTAISDYSFGGMATNNSNRTAHWVPDPNYKTQVNYELLTPCDLEMRPPLGPDVPLTKDEPFRSFTSFVMLHDSTERERQSLGIRRLYRTVAPWTTQNPLMLHLTSTDPKVVRTAIDQAAECGFEMIVISFWSGLDMEDVSDANLAKFRSFREYANKQGVELGGYSLLASRSIDAENNVVNPKPIFGNSPCLESRWGQAYFQKLEKFFTETGFDLLEHDGNYPGDTCASDKHPGHTGLDDSQWRQYERIRKWYEWCRARDVFLNVPDNYFLAGSNKTGMGYREVNWSLPRAQQHIHARQNLFDGTWDKTPSMGWMMTPLVEYQGGGPAATIEPLKEHLVDYRLHLLNNLGYGAQSCYRGPRLYDAPETKAMVQQWVQWFKARRDILESDVIHVRRADGRRIDGVVHVNPKLPIKGLAVLYNPTNGPLTEEVELPIYYAGLRDRALVEGGDSDGGKMRRRALSLDGSTARIKVTVPPMGMSWIEFRSP